MKYHQGKTCHDGFTSESGVFRAQPGDMERIEVSKLRKMFLPRLSVMGQKAFKDNPDLVRCQLKHYGVQFEEDESFGRGTDLMKKALREGKCNEVPRRILELQHQMHLGWLSSQKPLTVNAAVDLWIAKRFLFCGQPDPTRTTTVIGAGISQGGDADDLFVKAARNVVGLHHQVVTRQQDLVVFVGWDAEAVERKAGRCAETEKKKILWQEAEKKALDEQTRLQDQQKRLRAEADDRRNPRKRSRPNNITNQPDFRATSSQQTPIGSYIVECKAIERQWDFDYLTIDIHSTLTPGIFEAEFSFGLLDGLMILCTDELFLERYCAGHDGRSPDISTLQRNLQYKTKRRQSLIKGTDKSKPADAQPREYHVRLKCRETGENMIIQQVFDGTIVFDSDFDGLTGEADLDDVGYSVPFKAQKVSVVPTSFEKKWYHYSNEQYETERVGRWKNRGRY